MIYFCNDDDINECFTDDEDARADEFEHYFDGEPATFELDEFGLIIIQCNGVPSSAAIVPYSGVTWLGRKGA
jgi:hypothetical protein